MMSFRKRLLPALLMFAAVPALAITPEERAAHQQAYALPLESTVDGQLEQAQGLAPDVAEALYARIRKHHTEDCNQKMKVIYASSGAKAVIQQKCYSCHEMFTSMNNFPFYGHIGGPFGLWAEKNPVRKHVEEGVEALDFQLEFPILARAKGYPSQANLLKAIGASATNATMPPKDYLITHRKHKLTEADKTTINKWVEEGLKIVAACEQKEQQILAAALGPASPAMNLGIAAKAEKVVQENCMRCHNPTKKKGDLDLSNFATINAQNLMESIEAGDMPPTSPLSDEDKAILKEWIAKGAPRTDTAAN